MHVRGRGNKRLQSPVVSYKLTGNIKRKQTKEKLVLANRLKCTSSVNSNISSCCTLRPNKAVDSCNMLRCKRCCRALIPNDVVAHVQIQAAELGHSFLAGFEAADSKSSSILFSYFRVPCDVDRRAVTCSCCKRWKLWCRSRILGSWLFVSFKKCRLLKSC